jgi:hypothetical protein
VPEHWRIRTRVAAGRFGAALAQVAWAPDGSDSAGTAFLATADRLETHPVSDGAGTHRLAVAPYADTAWYVEVDALR